MQEIKELQSVHRALDKMNLDQPDVILISGSDTGVLEALLERIRHRLHKDIGPFETVVFSGEGGDESRLQQEIFNIPLFSPYRLLIVRQGEELFRNILASKSIYNSFLHEARSMPDRTLLVIQYDGQPTKKMTAIFHDQLLHFITRDLYANQIIDAIRNIAGSLHLHLDEESIHLLRESVEPKNGAIESTLHRLKEMLDEDQRRQPIGVEQVREALFPGMGCNSFALVDALFSLDHRTVQRELIRFNPSEDSFFGILKLILNRANEIRLAKSGIGMGMNDDELLSFLALKNRPPFIQKKILSRLKAEINRFTTPRLRIIYDFIIECQRDFRSNIPVPRQNLIFQQRILSVFFT